MAPHCLSPHSQKLMVESIQLVVVIVVCLAMIEPRLPLFQFQFQWRR